MQHANIVRHSVILTFVAVLLGCAAVSSAEVITVSRSDDRDLVCQPYDCSLREAVKLATSMAGDDTIVFNRPLPSTITLTGGAITINTNMTIQGPAVGNEKLAGALTINANNTGRIFSVVGNNLTVTIGGLRLTGGNGGGVAADGHGGAIFHQGTGSTLRLDTMTLAGNSTGASNDGGAIFSQFGTLSVRDSTFHANTATRTGGGIYFEGTLLTVSGSTFSNNIASGTADQGGGGIYSEDQTILVNSTFSGNTSSYAGGGLNFSTISTTALTIRNCTFTGNTAVYGGGIFHQEGTTILANSIVALNTGGNLYSAGSITQFSNYTGASPMLAPLADNGGPTQTHALQAGSPAINAGNAAQALDASGQTLTQDQRGSLAARFNGAVDIGAFESGSLPATTFTVTRNDDRAATCNPGDCSLREAVSLANATAGDEMITFATALAGQTIVLTGGSIDITSTMMIIGLGCDSLTVDANNTGRIFSVVGVGISATVAGLKLTKGTGGGITGDGHGGAILQAGAASKLTLDGVILTGNRTGAANDGGAVFSQFGSLIIRRSTFSGNTASRTGGAVYFEGTALTVSDSTFSDNTANGNADQGGGGIYSEDPTVIVNSTFTGNKTMYAGGGLNFSTVSTNALVVRNSTFSENSARFGGGMFLQEGVSTIANTIISLNTATTSGPGIFTSGGTLTQISNYTGAAPLLAPLGNYGGPTPTRALYCGSPAINAGSNAQALSASGSALTTDQRGGFFVRASGTVDIGAFEAQPCATPPPTSFLATPTSTTAVALNWTAASGATAYEIWRTSSMGTAYTLVNSTGLTSFGDGGMVPDTAYLYKVRAIGSTGPSAFAMDVATTTMFTDPVLNSSIMVKAIHVTQLRTAVNAMRVTAMMAPATFTDVSPAGLLIKKVHLDQLRLRLNEARAAIGLPALVYTDPTVAAGSTVVKAAHFMELRQGVH